jgi:hypothetical protein
MDAQHDDFSDGDDGSAEGRWARHLDSRRRLRRRAAMGLAAVGVGAIAFGLTMKSGSDGDGKTTTPQSVDVKEGSVQTQSTAKPASNDPGGVGDNPAATGLPTQNAPGGRVRTGTKEQGCFATMREYLDAWDRTGVEPDPCFTSQEPSEQDQPDGVDRSYNGEKF